MKSPFLVKVGALSIMTVTKPVAKFIQKKAAKHSSFKNFCISVGNTRNLWFGPEGRITQLERMPAVKPLTPEKAVAYGAGLLSEMVVFGVAAGIIYEEISRQDWNDTQERERKERLRQQRDLEREERFAHLERIVATLSHTYGYDQGHVSCPDTKNKTSRPTHET